MMDNKLIVTVTRFLLPFIIAFSFYIQINGNHAPGGGFQAGIIMASAFMLCVMVFGYEFVINVISITFLKILSIFGILLYGCTGVICMFYGQEFLNYNALDNQYMKGQALGTAVIEWGVAITVFATFSLVYVAFTTRGSNEYNIN